MKLQNKNRKNNIYERSEHEGLARCYEKKDTSDRNKLLTFE